MSEILGKLSLPFLVFCIFAIIVWVVLSERKQDRLDAAEKKKEGRR